MQSGKFLLAAAAIVASAACNAERGNEASSSNAPIEAVAPPQGGDWTKMVRMSPEGGFVMGNPNADVKVVEFGSMTCPHCAEFDETGFKPLVDKYVKTGRVSFEFRNYVRDPFDLAASLIARCGGPERFFPLTNGLFADQREWTGRLQEVPAAQMQALQSMPPQQQFLEIAKLSGLQTWAAQRGVPSAKTNACLTNQDEVNRLVQMTSDVTTQYPQFQGTPSFAINGEFAENTSSWEQLEARIRDALGG